MQVVQAYFWDWSDSPGDARVVDEPLEAPEPTVRLGVQSGYQRHCLRFFLIVPIACVLTSGFADWAGVWFA